MSSHPLRLFSDLSRLCLCTSGLLIGIGGCSSSDGHNPFASPKTTPASPPIASVSPSPTVSAAPVAPIAQTPSGSLTPSTASPAISAAFDDIAETSARKQIMELGQLGVFGNLTGKFNPSQPITRAEFVRWLVNANNAIFATIPERQIRVAEPGESTFSDVPSTHPDFRYIQGMANSGFAIGYDEKTFKPDQLLTREEMISIKDGLDLGTPKPFYKKSARSLLEKFNDHEQVSAKFAASIASDIGNGLSNQNLYRTFGLIKALRPKSPVTRAEATICMSVIGSRLKKGDENSEYGGTAENALNSQ
jgi:hypothetical protein